MVIRCASLMVQWFFVNSISGMFEPATAISKVAEVLSGKVMNLSNSMSLS